MDDIYGRLAPTFGGAFAADAALFTFSGLDLAGGVGLISQAIDWDYKQTVTRLWEIGTLFTYYVVGRAQGMFQTSRVLGPRPLMFDFYAIYGNACNAGANTIAVTLAQGCQSPFDAQGVDTAEAMYLYGCVLEDTKFAIKAEQMMLAEQASGMYISLVPQQDD